MIGATLLLCLLAAAQPQEKPAVPPASPAAVPEQPVSPAEIAPGKIPEKPKPVETFQTSMQKQRAAMEIQRAAVRRQMEMATEWRGAPTADAPECDPLPEIELAPMIDGAAQGNQLQTKLLRGVIEQESGKRPCAVSVKGAKGMMQLMPATAEQFHVDDPFDAKQNIEAGAKYLKQLLDRYKGDVKLALAAYNAGPTAVDQKNGIPDIKETQDYVKAIVEKLK